MTHRTIHRAALLLTACCLLLAACGTTAAQSDSQAATATPTNTVQTPGTRIVAPVGQTPTPSPAAATPADLATATTNTPDPVTVGQVVTTACGLINQQEAAAALGADPGPGQETPLGDTASACTYLSGSSSLQLSLTPTGGTAIYDHEHAGIPTGTPGITEISGIGDGAFSQINGTRAAINFDKDDALVVIGLTTAGTTATQDQLTTLATTAAGRI